MLSSYNKVHAAYVTSYNVIYVRTVRYIFYINSCYRFAGIFTAGFYADTICIDISLVICLSVHLMVHHRLGFCQNSKI